MNIVNGSATPTIPNTKPPSTGFAIAGTFSRPNSTVAALMNTTSSVTTMAANTPRATPASSCQSSNLYCGTL